MTSKRPTPARGDCKDYLAIRRVSPSPRLDIRHRAESSAERDPSVEETAEFPRFFAHASGGGAARRRINSALTDIGELQVSIAIPPAPKPAATVSPPKSPA